MKLITVAAVSLGLALACQHDSKPPPPSASRLSLAQVAVGSWGEYLLRAPPETNKVVVSVVARDARATVVETSITAEGAPSADAIVERRSYAANADFGAVPIAAAVQVGRFAPMSKDPTEPDGSIDLASLRARRPDAVESVEVPAGRFECSKYRVELSPTEAADVWLSRNAGPTGIVKMSWTDKAAPSTPGSRPSMLLLRVGSGAQPAITTPPAAFDGDALASQLISIAARDGVAGRVHAFETP